MPRGPSRRERSDHRVRPSPCEVEIALPEHLELAWTEWRPLNGAWKGSLVPTTAGLYRIRRAGRDDLDYIGQTGSGTMTLRKRLAMLAGVFAAEMPYGDPHTAAPALWAFVQGGAVLDVSTATVEGATPWRKGLEAVAIALYRQQHGCSPSVNFGRMPPGYAMSSGNNTELVATGKRFRGARTADTHPCHALGVPSPGALDGPTQRTEWCGLRWSRWQPLQDAAEDVRRATGVYRMRGDDRESLLYVGQGVIGARLAAHLRKCSDTTNIQGGVFASARRLECSYVVNDAWVDHHQRLEVENDLIASHVLTLGSHPDRAVHRVGGEDSRGHPHHEHRAQVLRGHVAGTKRIEYRRRLPFWKKRIEPLTSPFKLRLLNGMTHPIPEAVVMVTRDRAGREYRLHLGRVVAVKRWGRRSHKPRR
jgi:hypothetical protein